MYRKLALALAVLLFAGFQAAIPSPENPDPDSPRPIAALDSVFLEELTWIEIRDSLKSGKKTILIPTGGVEQNGPYLAAGKHNYILRATTESIARKLGDTLVAPIVPFVPEGNIDPPTGHMKYPSTVSVTEETFQRLLTDICSSFRTHGFEQIVLIGDSGGNQTGMKAVAAQLNEKWSGGRTRVHFIPEYYNYGDVAKWLETQGIKQTPEGLHDDFAITTQMMLVDPTTVRMKERIAAGKFRINGVDLAPAERAIEWGKKVVEYRTGVTVKAIRKARGEG
jgi:creatinine amidohydrolase